MAARKYNIEYLHSRLFNFVVKYKSFEFNFRMYTTKNYSERANLKPNK